MERLGMERPDMESLDRVRSVTPVHINQRLDTQAETRLQSYEHKSPAEISHRIEELEREWDVERVLEANASVLALTGLVLGLRANRRWLMLPGVVLPFLLQHALQGWCPPLPILRRLGVRTRKEIEREKFALKLLRGDFNHLAADDSASVIWRSVQS